MTEAQKCLYHIAENMRMDKSISKEGYEYFQQAIKALEQEPCEDCISREEAVTEINKYHMTSGVTHQCVWNECVGVIAKTIQELPPVTPQPKTGHWIKVTNGRGGHECDLCREYASSYKNGDEYLSKYCPNCGAKMFEPQESEERRVKKNENSD